MALPPYATTATPRKPLPVLPQRYKLAETSKYADLRRGVASLSETGSRPASATDATCRSANGPTVALTATCRKSLPVYTYLFKSTVDN